MRLWRMLACAGLDDKKPPMTCSSTEAFHLHILSPCCHDVKFRGVMII